MDLNVADMVAEPVEALHLVVSGRVQGVGFRPFIYRLAHTHNLTGWVRNRTGQVEIHVQGESQALYAFTRRLLQHAPPLSQPLFVTAVLQATATSTYRRTCLPVTIASQN
jgi:hydrogenase maturation factor HypF (carbamoyltransferase family)